ncbi:ABC transporter substrate-binding protein [Pseudochrobactrum sp. MP213Fo]|uniref:ABC transporter substrate-binding protein n=1 Tax=Pseudochrobactrum sp. MP213Fo TaxID=3022250 RepID=UPI003B9EB372
MPERVMSLNLCTDILALSLAETQQLISVSTIAADPVSSPVAEQALAYQLNHARLEEILALRPDLVLASVFTAPEKLAVLEQAGIRVERFGYASNFADIREQIKQMGEALGQQTKAAAQIEDIDATIIALQKGRNSAAKPLTAILYEPNGFTSGGGTLADETLRLLGVTNLGAENSSFASGRVGLEALVQLHPDLIIVPEFYNKPALAYQNYTHPVMGFLTGTNGKNLQQVSIPMRYWSCGSVYTLEAAKLLKAAINAQESNHAR